MQTTSSLERKSVNHGQGTAQFAVGELEFLSAGERSHKKNKMLKADGRIYHDFAVDLEGLAQQFTARKVDQRLAVVWCIRPRKDSEQAT